MNFDHILVISHRRSGTHLTIDAIRNNFEGYGRDYLNLDRLTERHPQPLSLAAVNRQLQKGPCVIKSHTHASFAAYFDANPEVCSLVETLLGQAKVIYVCRDGRDVLTSLYYYMQKTDPAVGRLPMSDFLAMENDLDAGTYPGAMNRAAYWAYHVDGWTATERLFTMTYESLLTEYQSVVGRLADYLQQPFPSRLVDVRRQESFRFNRVLSGLARRFLNQWGMGKSYTSVSFRKGVIGDYKNHFQPQDKQFFVQIAGETLSRLGYTRLD